MRKISWLVALIAVISVSACKKDSNSSGNTGGTTTTPVNPNFIKGADVSWVTQMEAANYKFYNSAGTQEDLFQIMKEKNMNTIRLRVWVNPSDGWCNTTDLVNKAVRAKNAGMKLLIDFHYSDSWADPSKQTKPAAWQTLDFATLTTTLHDYTISVLNALSAKGITPEYVQIGNEVDDGILWEDGRASKNMANFAKLITAGYNAVKSVSSSIQVIVHVSNGYNNTLFRYLFDGLKNNGSKWDIIGMSLYPSTSNWQTYDTECAANMSDMVSRYSTPVMIVECGMDASQPTIANQFLTDLIAKVRAVPNNQGLGVMYWEPEAYNWQNYGLGAFDTTGKPTVALDAFAN